MKYSNPVWGVDGTSIDLTAAHPTLGNVGYTATKDDPLFAQAVAGDFGAIAPYAAPAPTSVQIRATITGMCSARIASSMQGKDSSLLREAAFLNSLAAKGTPLSASQQAEAAMFDAINAWETAMVTKREALIATGDVVLARGDSAWPAPPAGLDAFLTGF